MSTENGEATEATPPAALTLPELKPKMELRGKVTKVDLAGAFVDIGVGVDGLLHISQLSTERVKNVSDVVREGDEITVWVHNVDVDHGRVSLTMIRPAALTWTEVQEGQVVSGTVVRVERFGAFVDIGAERPGMVHVSELASGYVNSPEEVVKVGDKLDLKVIKVNRKKKQIDLSRKALDAPAVVPQEVNNDDDNEEPPTVMELALRQAMQGTEMAETFAAAQTQRQSKAGKRDKRGADKRRQQQEEILSRTLQNRVK